jgi:DNA-binding NarL/FixJ family response regulator
MCCLGSKGVDQTLESRIIKADSGYKFGWCLKHSQRDTLQQMIKVLIADDYAPVRQGLRMLISICSDLLVVGEAVDGQTAVETTARLRPDVVLMDVHMPRVDGLQATERIRENSPGTSVLLMTIHDSDEVRAKAAAVGAFGLVSKNNGTLLLTNAIRQAWAH